VKRHVVLVGLPGAGKTTVERMVGPTAACGICGHRHYLIRKEGKPIAMIFAEKGEPGVFGEWSARKYDRRSAMHRR